MAGRATCTHDQNGNSAEEALKHFESPAFRNQQIYSDFKNRILPDVAATNLRPLMYPHIPDENALLDLRKKGVCDAHNKVTSQLENCATYGKYYFRW